MSLSRILEVEEVKSLSKTSRSSTQAISRDINFSREKTDLVCTFHVAKRHPAAAAGQENNVNSKSRLHVLAAPAVTDFGKTPIMSWQSWSSKKSGINTAACLVFIRLLSALAKDNQASLSD